MTARLDPVAASLDDIAPQLVSQLLRRCGHAQVRVAGTSMLPAIRPADVLLVRAVDVTVVQPGDVVLFEAGPGLFAHRVMRADRRGDETVLTTRGDMHWEDDAVVSAGQLLGRVEGQFRNGAIVPSRDAPRHRSDRPWPRLWFECLCQLRRLAQSFRVFGAARVV